LAKALSDEGLDEPSTTTEPGKVIGTPAYMSPEQARGKPTDKRSDIWSFGCILFEMLTGELPFQGETATDALARVLEREPDWQKLPAKTPASISVLLRRCLQKDLGRRLQHIGDAAIEISEALDQSSIALPAIAAPIDTLSSQMEDRLVCIAVLPFANMSADPENEYFSDGLAEELINALTQVEGLRVVARTSSFQFKGQAVDVREVGKRLNVTTVVEGSVRKAGNRLRVTAQLISVGDGYHLWSQRYTCELEDVFTIQDEISEKIVGALKGKLVGELKQHHIKRYTENVEAYNLYLQGRYHWNKRTPDGFSKAVV
jgi:TolB-like protein